MAVSKFNKQMLAIHDQWCVDNGHPIRKRPKFTSAKLQALSDKLQADDLNADNSARFVKNAKRPVQNSSKLQDAS